MEAFYKRPFCREAFLTGGLFEEAFLIRGLLSGRPFWCYPLGGLGGLGGLGIYWG